MAHDFSNRCERCQLIPNQICEMRISRTMFDFLRSNVRRIAGYTPGEQLNAPDIVKLNTNENPYPASPMVFEAVRAAMTGDKFRKYPQPLGDDFRKAAAKV